MSTTLAAQAAEIMKSRKREAERSYREIAEREASHRPVDGDAMALVEALRELGTTETDFNRDVEALRDYREKSATLLTDEQTAKLHADTNAEKAAALAALRNYACELLGQAIADDVYELARRIADRACNGAALTRAGAKIDELMNRHTDAENARFNKLKAMERATYEMQQLARNHPRVFAR